MPELPLRPTWLEVNLPQLRSNLENIRALVAPSRVLVVLKANAYGHGVDGVAPFIAPLADYIGVALVEEAVNLRRLGVDRPILVMGGILPEQVPAFIEYGLTLSASTPELLSAAQDTASARKTKIRVHLKMDTGMERIGVREYEAGPFLEESLACRDLEIEGIFSHFANSEAPDLVHARLQLERFEEILGFYEKRNLPPPPIRHMANSGAVLQLPESYYDMVRPGLLFYGISPVGVTARPVQVAPALTWRARLAFSKITPPGRPVSYGSLWQSDRAVRIVTIPCGYADGYFRRMTNRAQTIVNGTKYPQVGRICMDQFMVNLGEDEARVGDGAILLGRSASGATILAEELAEWAGTNEYEVLTSISARVPRLFLS